MKKYVFIDLEGTLVAPFYENASINNAHILKPDFMRETLNRLSPDEAYIFSYALYNDHDLKLYEIWLRQRLERVFNMRLPAPYSLEDFKRASEKEAGFSAGSLNLSTLRSLRGGKGGGFVDFINQVFVPKNELACYTLIDDEVKDSKTFAKNGAEINYIDASCISDD